MGRSREVSSSQVLSIIYHDIFDFPLTEDEIEKWEVRGGNVDNEVRSGIEKTRGYYHLKYRASIVLLRKSREKESIKKLKLARKISTKLSTIPTIKFIGVTGSLAMHNAKKESDIDLMIITTGGMLWTTRIIVRIVTKLQSYKVRQVGENEIKNAICFNMWLDEEHLTVPHKMRNLYTAHEVLQVIPLVNKGDTFEKFLESNKWALDYWPSAGSGKWEAGSGKPKPGALPTFYILLSTIIEPLACFLQKVYMHRHRTRETIERGRAFFHPIDWPKVVLREFEKRIGN